MKKNLIAPTLLALPASVMASTTLRGSESSSSDGEPVRLPLHMQEDGSEVYPGTVGSDFVGINKNVANIWDAYDEKSESPVYFEGGNMRREGPSLTEQYVENCIDQELYQKEFHTHEEIARHRALNEELDGHILSTSHLHHVSETILNQKRKGRVFMMVEDPIDSFFESFPIEDANEQSVFDYIKSDDYVDNNMIRKLVGKESKRVMLSNEDLENAKSILSHKVLVGISEEFDESIRRFSKYFGWKETSADCLQSLDISNTNEEDSNSHVEAKAVQAISNSNGLDMSLFQFAVDLFKQQAILFEVDASTLN